MQRFQHDEGWRPANEKRGFYKYWDYCKKCRHLQHYGDAFVPSQSDIEMEEYRTGASSLRVLLGEAMSDDTHPTQT